MIDNPAFIQSGMSAETYFLPCFSNQESLVIFVTHRQTPSLNLYLLPWSGIGFSLCFLTTSGLCSPVCFPKN